MFTFTNGQGEIIDRNADPTTEAFTMDKDNVKVMDKVTGVMIHQKFGDMPCTFSIAAREKVSPNGVPEWQWVDCNFPRQMIKLCQWFSTRLQCGNSSDLVMELLQSFAKPLIFCSVNQKPLFRVMSWNNDIHCMFYFIVVMWLWWYGIPVIKIISMKMKNWFQIYHDFDRKYKLKSISEKIQYTVTAPQWAMKLLIT